MKSAPTPVPSRRRPTRSPADASTLAAGSLLAVLLLAAAGFAQPSAEGAVSTLEDKPEGSTEPATFSTVCAVSAEDLAAGQGCAGLVDCTLPTACELEGGLDHVAAGTGLRNRDAATLELAGAPPGAVAVAAWLYWGLIADGTETGQHDLKALVLDGHPLTGELLAIGQEPCWVAPPGEAPPMFRAYRRSVLDRLHPGINGEYRVEVPSSGASDGSDPWRGATAPRPWVEGASLLVLYAHPDVPSGAHFYLHEGPALLAGYLDVLHDLPPVVPPAQTPSLLRHTRIGGDGQRRAGYVPTFPFTTELSWLPWCAYSPVRLAGPGSAIDLVSDWKGSDGGPVTQLWDTQSTELSWTGDLSSCQGYRVSYNTLDPTEALPTGASSLAFDCVVVVAHALTVR